MILCLYVADKNFVKNSLVYSLLAISAYNCDYYLQFSIALTKLERITKQNVKVFDTDM